MTQIIYIVSFQAPDAVRNKIYGGMWGAYATFEKATEKVENWIAEYNETIHDFQEHDNGLFTYYTDKGTWVIEPTILDD